MLGIQSTLVAIFILVGVASLADEAELQAERLSLTPGTEQLVAEGRVRLKVGDLEINASSLSLDFNSQTARIIDPFILGYGDALIEARELTLSFSDNLIFLTEPTFKLNKDSKGHFSVSAQGASCKDGACTINGLRATGCPHDPEGYRIEARKMVLHQSGDVDLSSPVFVVDETKVLALPWIRLRPANTFGFLPPRVGYSKTGGFIVGPAGFIPLGPSAHMEGHVAARTASGLEASTTLRSPNLDLRVDHLVESNDSEARIRMGSHVQLDDVTVAVDVDLVTSRQVIDETAMDPFDRAISHTISRGLVSNRGDSFLLETSFELLQPLDAQYVAPNHSLVPTATLEVGLPAAPLLPFLWPEFNLLFSRRGAADDASIVSADGRIAPGHSVLDINYGLGVPGRLGPFGFEALAALRHQAWQRDMSGQGGNAVHSASMAADVTLPLARDFHTVRHLVKPYVRYRLTPWQIGSSPDWVIGDSDRLRLGQGVEVGLLTKLVPFKSAPIASIEIWERFDLPGYEAEAGPAYIAAAASFGRDPLTVSLDGSFDHTLQSLSLGGISLMSHSHHIYSLAVGARWVGPGLGPHLDQPFGVATGPWLISRFLPYGDGEVEIFEDLDVSITRRLSAIFGMRVAVWPEASLHVLQYGLELGSSCGCVAISLIASHRLSSAVPDVMAGISIPGM